MKKGYREYRITNIFLLVIFAVLLFSCEKKLLSDDSGELPFPFAYSGKKTITITGYTEPGGIVSIPATIDGKPVIAIGDEAFRNKSLTDITIPNSVTEIGDFAFFGNQLTSIIIPDRVTKIGNYAFGSNQLTSITIPNSVTKIGDYTFCNNQLTSITIPNSVTEIGDCAFRNNRLTSITISTNVKTCNEPADLDGGCGTSRFSYLRAMDAFGGNFYRAYMFGDAGTYIRPDTYSTWTKTTEL